MRYCIFKSESTREIIQGTWTPFNPNYHPFVEVDNFCNPCYSWRFQELIRGKTPAWRNLIRNPATGLEFTRFFKIRNHYQRFAVTLLKMLARSNFPDSILNLLDQPNQLLDQIRGNSQIENFHNVAMEYVSMFLRRLRDNDQLIKYRSNENVLFNIQILNENFDLFRNDNTPISLRYTPQVRVGTTQPQEETYIWRDSFAVIGEIPLLDLENRELKSIIFLADNFFNPPVDFSDLNNLNQMINSILIQKEFHKLWILRESLQQLSDQGLISPNISDVSGGTLFTPSLDLTGIQFEDFELIVETIDHTIQLDLEPDFRNITGQAAIIFYLLYENYPSIVNSLRGECLMHIGQEHQFNYYCPLSGRNGCGMSDRRQRNRTFPRDRVEINVYKFLRLLRDETVFKHKLYYAITRFFPNSPLDLNQFGKFWIGDIYFEDTGLLVFRPSMPITWELPPDSTDTTYEIVFISPLCYERGFKVQINSFDGNRFVLNPIQTMNPWTQDVPFIDASSSNPLSCVLGKFSLDEDFININRQKKKLVKAIHFQRRTTIQGQEIERTPEQVMEERLTNRTRRTGLATFGRYARYV